MREGLHLFLREPREVPGFHPRPGTDVGNAVLALPLSGKILLGLPGVFARQLDLEHAVDAQSFVLEALDSVYFQEGC